MKEQTFLEIIEKKIGSEFIGDDCAYIKELGIVVTQDSLVENIHFKREWYTPYELGYKSIAVNISDILASGGKPKYVTVGISLPNNTNTNFIKEFYEGANSALYGAKIVGGDITGSKNEIFVSVMAIGTTEGRKISSRKNAKAGYSIVTKGNLGSSATGLRELMNNGKNQEFIKAHKMPDLEQEFSEYIAENIKEDYAMMDTSDGLADALFKIAESSNVTISVDYNKIPHHSNVSREDVLFGGEDYKLIAALPKEFALTVKGAQIIGEVLPYSGSRLLINENTYFNYDDLSLYNHFSK